jgi:hypothetical protein
MELIDIDTEDDNIHNSNNFELNTDKSDSHDNYNNSNKSKNNKNKKSTPEKSNHSDDQLNGELNTESDIELNVESEFDISEINGAFELENRDLKLVEKKNIRHDNKHIMNFVSFCIELKLFDDTFYDFSNAYSIIATKLPSSFDLMSVDGKIIKKNDFTDFFINKLSFDGDINEVYDEMNRGNNNYITWEDYIEFFVQFVRYITI